MVLLDPKEAKKGFDSCKDFVHKLVTKHGGEPRVIRKWDERKLQFTIKKQKRALYMLAYFDGPPDSIVKIEREAQLSEVVLRALVVRAESVPPKVMEEPLDAAIAPQIELVPVVAEDTIESEIPPEAAAAAK